MANDFTDLGRGEDTDSTSGMSFFDHLEELRWRIIRSLLSVVVGTIICWFFIDWLVDGVLLRPVTVINAHASGMQQQIHLQNLKPFGQLFLYMQVAIVAGVILSLPYILYELWAFIAPGLMPKERKYIKWIVFFTTFCFFADGVVVSLQDRHPDARVHETLPETFDRRYLHHRSVPHAGNRSRQPGASCAPSDGALRGQHLGVGVGVARQNEGRNGLIRSPSQGHK